MATKMKINLKWLEENYERLQKESKDVDDEYPLLIKCVKNSDYDRFKIGDFFAAKHGGEIDGKPTYSTKPVLIGGIWMYSDFAEIIYDKNEK
jgi:hypothetical protein